jgi:predicted short-subunit dehydrogenase-like oxidoreductase (DUF2520 family)
VAPKPSIAIIGPGSLGAAMAVSLKEARYKIEEIISRDTASSRKRAQQLARQVGAYPTTLVNSNFSAHVCWLCVPDGQIRACARSIAGAGGWAGKIVFHSSGALSSDELQSLRGKGAAVASVHPLMTFVVNIRPSLKGVPFALEGDTAAIRTARKIVTSLGGKPFDISKRHKAAYHAWGAFASPLLAALLATAEKVARRAGIDRTTAREMMLPIIRQTIANYAQRGPAGAFSGPIVRGDAATLKKHMRILSRIPDGKQVYLALARSALLNLPAKNKKLLRASLQGWDPGTAQAARRS